MREDAVQAVGDGPHDEAIEQGDRALGARACQDPARGNEPERLDGVAEAPFPKGSLVGWFDAGDRPSDAGRSLSEARIARAVLCLEAVFGGPDLLGERNIKHEFLPHLVIISLSRPQDVPN